MEPTEAELPCIRVYNIAELTEVKLLYAALYSFDMCMHACICMQVRKKLRRVVEKRKLPKFIGSIKPQKVNE